MVAARPAVGARSPSLSLVRRHRDPDAALVLIPDGAPRGRHDTFDEPVANRPRRRLRAVRARRAVPAADDITDRGDPEREPQGAWCARMLRVDIETASWSGSTEGWEEVWRDEEGAGDPDAVLGGRPVPALPCTRSIVGDAAITEFWGPTTARSSRWTHPSSRSTAPTRWSVRADVRYGEPAGRSEGQQRGPTFATSHPANVPSRCPHAGEAIEGPADDLA